MPEIDRRGHRYSGISLVEHVTLVTLTRCHGTICMSCNCCAHCDSCICPDGPCRNEGCGCWINDHVGV